MPYIKAQEYRRQQVETLSLRQRVRDLEREVDRNRRALADKMRVELERVGTGVVFHFFEKPDERWAVREAMQCRS